MERTEEKVMAKMNARLRASQEKLEKSDKKKEEDMMRKVYLQQRNETVL